ncbi:hypothetical protein, partial [Bradyrhizobium sp. ARR65]
AENCPGMVPWICRDVVGRYHCWSDRTPAYWFEALPAHGSKLVGTPTAAPNSMPHSGFVQSQK